MNEIPGFCYATVNGVEVTPLQYPQLFHGTCKINAAQFRSFDGLPERGRDIELIRHVEPLPGNPEESAFRGTCLFPLSPANDDVGAAYWAEDDGWVFEIHGYPGYDVNQLLQGRVPDGRGGFRGPLMIREQEIAIPARVPATYVPRFGRVVIGPRGPRVKWEDA